MKNIKSIISTITLLIVLLTTVSCSIGRLLVAFETQKITQGEFTYEVPSDWIAQDNNTETLSEFKLQSVNELGGRDSVLIAINESTEETKTIDEMYYEYAEDELEPFYTEQLGLTNVVYSDFSTSEYDVFVCEFTFQLEGEEFIMIQYIPLVDGYDILITSSKGCDDVVPSPEDVVKHIAYTLEQQ